MERNLRMKAIEIAQRLAQLNETESALQAYKLSLQEESDPTTQMEAAVYILQYGKGEDYKISYTFFRDLYNQGIFQENILEIMDEAFFEPNVKLLKSRYDRNCKLLSKYPYIFRKDFPKFEDLPIRFYPYDDNSFTPYYIEKGRFGEYINFKDPVISRNFFHDLENPILAEDVYSQYELEYLRDNVRKSEDVARENHIYLHYTSWAEFCSYLACLNLKPLLEEQKIVFLFEDESNLYPIDFKERFGIDYSQYTLKPVRLREITRIIWHTQLSSHNGGDFFNEIFDYHPNLIAMPSIMMDNIEETVATVRDALRKCSSLAEARESLSSWKDTRIVDELYLNRDRTDKDILLALYLYRTEYSGCLDKESRIAPVLFFQPHFSNILYQITVDEKGRAVLYSEEYERLKQSPILKNFKYIKTFTPMRRFTTSHGATVRFMKAMSDYENTQVKKEKDPKSVISDAISERILNRSFMIDPQDRLYKDSVLVRFEDGKLNPTATFTALAAFMDIPYTETMKNCTEAGGEVDTPGNAVGFDPVTVYRTYDDFVNDNERIYIEYFLRDAYEFYGYDFHYYDGQPMSKEQLKELINGFDTLDGYIAETWKLVFADAKVSMGGQRIAAEAEEKIQRELLENYMADVKKNRMNNVDILARGLYFINRNGQPLRLMPKLELDPALLEQPLYH